MFKKTLLALAVAGTSLAANAGTISVSVNETTTAGSAQEALDTKIKAIAATDGCLQAAKELGVTANLNGKTDVGVGNDAIAVINVTNVFESTSSVVFDANDSCEVTIAEATVGADSVKYSQEAAAVNGVTISAKQIAGIGGFQKEDTIVFTFAGVEIDPVQSASATLTDGQAAQATLVNIVNDNQLIFAFPSGYATTRANDILTLAGVVVKAGSSVDSISVSSETRNTSNIVVDNSKAAEVVKIAKQYSAKVDVKGDGIIDVQTERFDFATNSSDTSNTVLNQKNEAITDDTFVVETSLDAPTGKLVPSTGTMVIKGNFSWMGDLDANDDGKLVASEIAAGYTFSAREGKTLGVLDAATGDADTLDDTKAALNDARNELTLTYAGFGTDNEVSKYQVVTFNIPGTAGKASTALNEETYTASINLADSAKNALNVATDAEVAEWTLNGSVINVPYIPFGPSTQPVIRHTNKGNQTGDISVRYMVEGSSGNAETNEWKSLGVLVNDAKPGVRNLLTVIQEALEEELGNDKFKVALEITTNVPAEDVTVYAAAKVTAEGQDRLTIGAFSGK